MTRVKYRARFRPVLQAGLVAALVLVVSGCSSNLTGFKFPRFGLLGNDSQVDQSTLPPDPSGTGTRLSIQ
ncbi:MAG: hypothetical protein ACR2PO_06210 [Methyloligellaceae bacterium]